MPRPQRQVPPYDVALVRARLTAQAGVITRSQLTGLGVTDADIARLVRRKTVHRLSMGLFREGSGKLSPLQRAWWACLHHADSAIADLSALQLARDGTGGHLTLPIHVAVPAGRGSQPLPDVALHRVSRMDELVVRVGIPRMRAEHAALRVASRAEGTDAVVAALADAVNWRVTTPQRLLGALPQLPRLPQRRLITEVSRTSPQERARCSSGGT